MQLRDVYDECRRRAGGGSGLHSMVSSRSNLLGLVLQQDLNSSTSLLSMEFPGAPKAFSSLADDQDKLACNKKPSNDDNKPSPPPPLKHVSIGGFVSSSDDISQLKNEIAKMTVLLSQLEKRKTLLETANKIKTSK
jgi:hypothetical protein